MKPSVGVIVAAAGSGSRLGRGSKALVRLHGRTTLARAHREAADAGLVGDDDAQLVAATGHAVTVVEGEPSNVKLTTPEDFGVVEALIKEQETATP